MNRNSRRHFVAAKFFQMLGAIAEKLHKRESLDATPAPLPCAIFIEAHHKSRPMVTAHEARSNDAEHTDVPIATSRHNRDIAVGLKIFVHPLLGFLDDMTLHALALAIVGIKSGGEAVGLAEILGEQQGQRL